ncbi:MAG: phosphotransferase [Prevotellaceae bacterium]|jgi:aminoglycoside/choline kinase family phosphotransferase|nr:phosphotransferase [Prevotellaceae bacterium]
MRYAIPLNLLSLFVETTREQPTEITPIANSGSNRQYYRIKSKSACFIGVFSDETAENNAFIYLAGHFSGKGLPVPKVVAVSGDKKCYLQSDLGDVSLFDYVANGIKTGNFSEDEQAMLHKTIALLPQFQVKGAQDLDFSQCYPLPALDRQTVMWDLNYFKYCFLKPSGIEFSELLLEKDFERLADEILAIRSDTFLYRDFQSRNIMIRNGEPYFIDFQGGRKGAIYYDVVSFIWQAKANFPPKLRQELTQTYVQSLKKLMPVDDEAVFAQRIGLFALFRTLQVLGAYGFRGLIEKKPHFIESIPFAMKNLKEILENDFSRFPYLVEILKKLIEKQNRCHCGLEPQSTSKQGEIAGQTRNDKLWVTVYSFSYKKGIPPDTSGNGGGFVFDCRAIDNPGRYEEYKHLTGLDKPVRDYLEKDGEILHFLASVKALTDASISCYIEREFTHLMISFGCTGGQHRSVYCAQYLAEHIAKKFSVKVKLIHREQEIEQAFGI